MLSNRAGIEQESLLFFYFVFLITEVCPHYPESIMNGADRAQHVGYLKYRLGQGWIKTVFASFIP